MAFPFPNITASTGASILNTSTPSQAQHLCLQNQGFWVMLSGLATVCSIVAQREGWVEVDSVVGKGTSVLVFLPGMESKALPQVPRSRPKNL